MKAKFLFTILSLFLSVVMVAQGSQNGTDKKKKSPEGTKTPSSATTLTPTTSTTGTAAPLHETSGTTTPTTVKTKKLPQGVKGK